MPGGIEVIIKPYARINYAVLHNQQVDGPHGGRRSIFETFTLHRLYPGGDPPLVDIEVSLYAGDHAGAWRQRRCLEEVTTDLATEIHVPLTSVLARSLRESLRTSIETRVRIGEGHHRPPNPLGFVAGGGGVARRWDLPRVAALFRVAARPGGGRYRAAFPACVVRADR